MTYNFENTRRWEDKTSNNKS